MNSFDGVLSPPLVDISNQLGVIWNVDMIVCFCLVCWMSYTTNEGIRDPSSEICFLFVAETELEARARVVCEVAIFTIASLIVAASRMASEESIGRDISRDRRDSPPCTAVVILMRVVVQRVKAHEAQ